MANETVARKGFFFNQDNCIGCRTCQIACKDKNDNEIGVISGTSRTMRWVRTRR